MTIDVYHIPAPLLFELTQERQRQISKFGQQDHPWTYGPNATLGGHLGRIGTAREMTGLVDHLMQRNGLTYADILLEEVAEAIEARDAKALHSELIQVTAVGIAALESLGRNGR